MANFLETLNNNLVFWIDGSCNSNYKLYNYSTMLNLVESAPYTFNFHLNNGVTETSYRFEDKYKILGSRDDPHYTVYNEKNNLSSSIGAAVLARNYNNFYFNYPLTTGYTVEISCDIGSFYMYSQDEMADMDFTMFTLVSSQTAGGFKIDATSNNINDYMDNFENFYDTLDSNIFTDNKTYKNLIVDQYGISKYPLKSGQKYHIVFNSNGRVYVGGAELSHLNVLYSHTGGTISQNVGKNYCNLILGNWTADASDRTQINYYMTPGWPGTIYYLRLYKYLTDDQCKLLSKYGSTIELSSNKKLYTASRLTEGASVNAFGRNGRVECKNELIEGKSSQIGFHSNGDLWVDEFIEI